MGIGIGIGIGWDDCDAYKILCRVRQAVFRYIYRFWTGLERTGRDRTGLAYGGSFLYFCSLFIFIFEIHQVLTLSSLVFIMSDNHICGIFNGVMASSL